MVVLICFVMCGCVYLWVCAFVGVLVKCVFVFTLFCIVCTVFFFLLFHFCIFLFVLYVLM